MTWNQLKDIISRRWRLIATVCAFGMILSVLTFSQPEEWHRMQLQFIVGQVPPDSALELAEENYFNWRASEYVSAGISDWSNGTLFAESVSERLQAWGYDEMTTGEVAQYMAAQAGRSLLTIQVVDATEEGVRDFGQAVVEVLEEQSGNEIPQLKAGIPVIFSVDSVDTAEVEEYVLSVGDQLAVPTRLWLSLISGFIVVAVLELLDPTIRYRTTAKRLKMELLGEIPIHDVPSSLPDPAPRPRPRPSYDMVGSAELSEVG